MWYLLFAFVVIVAARPHHHHHRGPPPCGLPPYIDDLPDDAKETVKDIWKNYKDGDKCYNEQGLTREVLDSLPKEKRIQIFKSGFLPFLRGASADVQKQFKELFKDRKIPRDEKHQKMKELAEKTLTGKQLEEFNKFYEKKVQEKADFKEKVAKLSSEAKSAWEKMEKLNEEKWEIMAGLSDSARDELFQLFHERFGGHRFGGPERI